MSGGRPQAAPEVVGLATPEQGVVPRPAEWAIGPNPVVVPWKSVLAPVLGRQSEPWGPNFLRLPRFVLLDLKRRELGPLRQTRARMKVVADSSYHCWANRTLPVG